MRITEFRDHENALIPNWYHWGAHIGLNFTILIVAMVWPMTYEWENWELIALPAFVFAWALIEYVVHRFILHGDATWTRILQHEHTESHHGYFTNDHMSAGQLVDIRRVLLLPHHLLPLLALNGLIAMAAGKAFFIAGVIYILIYEIVHAYAHSPFGTVQSHRTHHDPEFSTKNFAIVFPIIDRWFGTYRR